MASEEGDIPDLAKSAGFLTLSAQLSREAVDRVVNILRRELTAGRDAAYLADELQRNLPDYDAHSRGLLMQMGSQSPIADDFPASLVASSNPMKANTLELKLTRAPEGINLFSLVFHKNGLWLITEFEGTRCVLKQV
jgi:hypothetical protein